MMQKRGSWSTAIGLIVAALLLVPGLAPAADSGPYFGIGGTFAKQDFDTGDLDKALAGSGLSADFGERSRSASRAPIGPASTIWTIFVFTP